MSECNSVVLTDVLPAVREIGSADLAACVAATPRQVPQHPPPQPPGLRASHSLIAAQAAMHADDHRAALEHCNAAVADDPGNLHTHLLRARALFDLGLLPDAQEALNRALQLDDGTHAATILNLRSQVAQQMSATDDATCPLPAGQWWRGQDLRGKTLLVIGSEKPSYGDGDILQALREVRLLAARGAKVVVRTRRRLCRLVRNCEGVAGVVADSDPSPAFDYWSTLRGLISPTTLASWEVGGPRVGKRFSRAPYLHPEPALVAHWRGELSHWPTFRVGINHHGNVYSQYGGIDPRAWPLRSVAALAAVPGVTLFNLLRPGADGYADVMEADFPLVDLGPRLDTGADSWVDTAAVLANMDLLICSDTAIAHLGGALGFRTWLLLGEVWQDDRWGMGGPDLLEPARLYASVHTFRLRLARFLWDRVFGHLAHYLDELVRNSKAHRCTRFQSLPSCSPSVPAALTAVR